MPYADVYEGLWKNPLSLQQPLASIEIVAWDSSLSLVISKNNQILDNIRLGFSLSEDLEVYNEG